MARPPAWLIDTSAAARLTRSTDFVTWAERVERGLVRVTTPTLLELGWSARSADDLTGQPVERLVLADR